MTYKQANVQTFKTIYLC